MRKALVLLTLIVVSTAFSQDKYTQKKLDSLEIELSKAPNDSLKISLLNMLGYDYAIHNNKRNIKFNNEAIALSQKVNYDMGVVDSYINLGLYYEHQNDTLTQLEYLHEALKVANKKKDGNILGKVYFETAFYYWARDNRAKTKYNFLKAEEFFIKTKNKSGLSNTLLQFGYYFRTIMDLNSALKYYKRHAALFDKDDFQLVNTYSVIIDLYTSQNNYDKALEYCKLSKNIFEKNNQIKNRGYYFLHNNLGDIYEKQNQFAKSLEAYDKALIYFLKIENYWQSALIYISKASVFKSLKQKDKVVENINTALENIKKQDACINYETVYTKIGSIYFDMKEFQKALEYHLMAYRACTFNEPYKEIDLQEFNIGTTYLQLARNIDKSKVGDNIESKNKLLHYAEQYLNKSIKRAAKKGNLSLLKDAYLDLSEISKIQRNNSKAFEQYKLHILYKDSLANVENRELLVQNQMQYEFDQKEKVSQLEQEKKDALSREELAKEKNNRNIAVGGIGFFVLIAGFSGFAYVEKRKDNKIISEEKKKSDDLLLNILPAEIAKELKEKGSSEAKHFESVSIMFTDFKDFTKLSEKIPSTELIQELNYCFKEFDNITTKHGVEKIKTIGDSYMAVCGLPAKYGNHAQKMVDAALEIRDFIEIYKKQRQQEGKSFFEMRIGINSGEVVAGIIGIKKFAYDIWGDAVNTASRMESNGEVGKVNISESTYNLVKDDFSFTYRGEMDAKGKGNIKMYFVEAKTGKSPE